LRGELETENRGNSDLNSSDRHVGAVKLKIGGQGRESANIRAET
jgi:hypothetical protein